MGILAAADYATGEITWLVGGILVLVLAALLAFRTHRLDGMPDSRPMQAVVVVAFFAAFVAVIGIVMDTAHNRGETLQAHADLAKQQFPKPQQLSVSEGAVKFLGFDCTLRVQQRDGRYVVTVFKNGSMIGPAALAFITSTYCPPNPRKE